MSVVWITQNERLGKTGPDGGTIVFEYLWPETGQIVIEKKIQAAQPEEFYAVTVAVFNIFIDTSYYKTQGDAMEHVNSIKYLIQALIKNFSP
jgi:hypothetical protein